MPAPVQPKPDHTLKSRATGLAIALIARTLTKTLRVEIQDDSPILTHTGGSIWAFWHNRLLIVPALYTRYTHKLRPATVLTSASRDGAVLAAVMRHFGLASVRGSSSKRGGQALVECRRRLRENQWLGITPDGPRGPAYQLQPGVIQLARLCHVPVLPVRVEYDSCWRLKSWDRFCIPRPFSRVRVHLLPFLYVQEYDIESHRAHLETLLKPETP